MPYLRPRPIWVERSAADQRSGLSRSQMLPVVKEGRASSFNGLFNLSKTTRAAELNTPSPGGSLGQAPLRPRRLIRRQNKIPISTCLPLAKRMFFSGTRTSTM